MPIGCCTSQMFDSSKGFFTLASVSLLQLQRALTLSALRQTAPDNMVEHSKQLQEINRAGTFICTAIPDHETA